MASDDNEEQTMNKTLNRHALSELCGPMDPDTFMSLVKRMTARGYNKRHPIMLYKGEVLDGWHRYQASLAADVPAEFEEFLGTFEDAQMLVLDEHTRRDWSVSQRLVIEVRINEAREKAAPGAGLTQTELAERTGSSERSVRQAERVVRNAIPQVVQKVADGDLSLKKAEQIAQLPAEMQKAAISKEPPAPPAVKKWKPAVVKPEVGASKEALEELKERNTVLVEEHERMEARLALHFMEGTEEEKAAAQALLATQHARIAELEHEVKVLKDSRDTYMNEASELRRQCGMYRNQLAKARA